MENQTETDIQAETGIQVETDIQTEVNIQVDIEVDAPPAVMTLFDKAMRRPEDYNSLPGAEQWDIDKNLGLLNWYGNCNHKSLTMCADCAAKWKLRFGK